VERPHVFLPLSYRLSSKNIGLDFTATSVGNAITPCLGLNFWREIWKSRESEPRSRATLKGTSLLCSKVGRATSMGTPQRISRGFHRVGVFLAAMIFAIGFTLIISDAVRLRLWDVRLDDLPMVLASVLLGLICLGLVCLALYGLVRAIGWVIGSFAAN